MVLILTTTPSVASGRKIAKYLLDGKLAACVSISSKTESHYTWKGKREKATEYSCWIKTRKSLSLRVKKAIQEIHPYEVPEIVILKSEDTHKPYFKWLYAETKT